MKSGLVIVGIWSAVLLILSLIISFAAKNFYSSNLPFIITTGTLFALAIWGLESKRATSVLFWIVVPLHGFVFLPFNFALNHWPGGDDGPGMLWFVFIGSGSCIAGVLAMVFVIAVSNSAERSKKDGE